MATGQRNSVQSRSTPVATLSNVFRYIRRSAGRHGVGLTDTQLPQRWRLTSLLVSAVLQMVYAAAA